MSEQPHESVSNMSEKRLGQLHLYKELMSAEERQGRYYLLVQAGATYSQAQKWRDWSPPHFQSMLDTLLNPTVPEQGELDLNFTELTA